MAISKRAKRRANWHWREFKDMMNNTYHHPHTHDPQYHARCIEKMAQDTGNDELIALAERCAKSLIKGELV